MRSSQNQLDKLKLIDGYGQDPQFMIIFIFIIFHFSLVSNTSQNYEKYQPKFSRVQGDVFRWLIFSNQ